MIKNVEQPLSKKIHSIAYNAVLYIPTGWKKQEVNLRKGRQKGRSHDYKRMMHVRALLLELVMEQSKGIWAVLVVYGSHEEWAASAILSYTYELIGSCTRVVPNWLCSLGNKNSNNNFTCRIYYAYVSVYFMQLQCALVKIQFHLLHYSLFLCQLFCKS